MANFVGAEERCWWFGIEYLRLKTSLGIWIGACEFRAAVVDHYYVGGCALLLRVMRRQK